MTTIGYSWLRFLNDGFCGRTEGAYPFLSSWSHPCFVKAFVDTIPLFLLFSFYLSVCFNFVLSLWTVHFWSFTKISYNGLNAASTRLNMLKFYDVSLILATENIFSVEKYCPLTVKLIWAEFIDSTVTNVKLSSNIRIQWQICVYD